VAKKDKQAKPETEEPEKKEGETPEGGDAPKKGFVKKLLGNKLILIGVGAVLLLAIGGGAGWYFFLRTPEKPPAELAQNAVPPLPAAPPNVTFFDVPDIIVNIQSADAAPSYLKLSLSLELDAPEEKPGLQALMPRIVDQFQGYLRELRMDDLRGSAGVMRLKEELLRRINAAAAPYRVRDVLLKQMIVQ
jgi:flagellar protein FliL